MKIETLPQLYEAYHSARKAMVIRCAKEGLTMTQTAEKLGTSPTQIFSFCSRYKISFAAIKKQKAAEE